MIQRRKRPKLRSSFEDRIVEWLTENGIDFQYEPFKIQYQKKPSKYTPDIVLGNGIIIEIKGYFDAEDRAKHLLIKEQHPEYDIRFVFYGANKKIHKNSPTTYADWADKHGFKYADKEIPEEWLHENPKENVPVVVSRRKSK